MLNFQEGSEIIAPLNSVALQSTIKEGITKKERRKDMLVPCFECGAKISSEAKTCPKCGYKGWDGYWWRAGETASKAAKYNSREEAQKELSDEYSKLMAQVRSSYLGKR